MSKVASILLKQFAEMSKSSLPNVGVHFLEQDVTEWHVNFFFPSDHVYYPGLILHLKMTFDDNYPTSSPNVELCTNMTHSHVFFPRICFSLLPDFKAHFQFSNTPRSAYWNPARTARSFLEDLYTFLLVDEDQHRTITTSHTQQALLEASAFRCKCGHCFDQPMPCAPLACDVEQHKESFEAFQERHQLIQIMKAAESALAESRPEEPLKFLSAWFSQRHDERGSVMKGASKYTRYPESVVEDLRCSITHANFYDEGVVMGFGIQVRQDRGRIEIETDMFPMTSEAFFDQNIRLSAGGLTLTHFIPLAINREHWTQKAQRIFKHTVETIASSQNVSYVKGVLLVIGELWKGKAVEMSKGNEHVSEKVLKAFCAFHHLLLSAANDCNLIAEEATRKIDSMASSPDMATKQHVPDLGRVLPLFLLSSVTWTMAGQAILKEQFTRNARWIVQSRASLANTSAHKVDRLQLSWEASATGLRLTAFQIRFLLAVKRWTEASIRAEDKETVTAMTVPPSVEEESGFQPVALKRTVGKTRVGKVAALSEVLAYYDALGGQPTEEMLKEFQQESKRVQAMGDYCSFFGAVGLGVPTRDQAHMLLEEAMARSASLRYHGSSQFGEGQRHNGRR